MDRQKLNAAEREIELGKKFDEELYDEFKRNPDSDKFTEGQRRIFSLRLLREGHSL